jgi:hypothetical protein
MKYVYKILNEMLWFLLFQNKLRIDNLYEQMLLSCQEIINKEMGNIFLMKKSGKKLHHFVKVTQSDSWKWPLETTPN